MSGSTSLETSTSRSVCSPIRSPMLSHGRVVELDRARDVDRQQLVRLLPQRVELGPDAEDDRHPVALDQRLEEVHEPPGPRPSTARCSASFFSVDREVGREEEHRQVAVLVHGVGELPELLAHSSSTSCSMATSNSARA